MIYTKHAAAGRLEALAREVDIDTEYLSADDIANMSERAAERLLGNDCPRSAANHFIDRAVSSESRKSDTSALEWEDSLTRRHPPRPDHIVNRTVDEALWRLLDSERTLVVFGSKGSGKSTLWRALMKPSDAFRMRYDVAVTIDCFSLRSRSQRIVEQDALYAQFDQEDSFHDFMKQVARSDQPLQCYLDAKLAIGDQEGARLRGLVVFDHVERLSSAPEIVRWFDRFVTGLKNAGVSVMMFHAGRPAPSMGGVLDRHKDFELGLLTLDELSVWWAQNRFDLWRNAGVTASDIYSVTGGTPRLIRDFGRFLECYGAEHLGAVLDAFEKEMTTAFSPEVSRLLNVAIKQPAVLQNPCSIMRNTAQDDFAATGAVAKRDDTLRFVCNIFSQKYKLLSSERGIAAVLMNGPDARLVSIMRSYRVLGRQFSMNLMQDVQPAQVWKRMARAFEMLRLERPEFWVRDPGNAKIWFLVYSDDIKRQNGYWKAKPLYTEDQPDVSLAVKTGRIVQRVSDEVVLPFIGENGRVSVLLRGKFPTERFNSFSLRLEERFLWHLALAVQPAAALAAERALARRMEKHWRSLAYRTMETCPEALDRGLSSILLQAGCNALVVLERGPYSWEVMDARATGEGGDSMTWRQNFGNGVTAELDNIASHPSGRGLVLADQGLIDVFPRLRHYGRLSGFLCPQPDSLNRSKRMIAFAFKADEADEIVGDRQMYLSMIARQANYVC